MKKVILFLVCLVGNIGFSQSVDDDPTLAGLKIGEIYSDDDKELSRSEENDYIIYENTISYRGKYAIYPYTDRFKIVCIRKWDEEKIKNDSFANSFTKEELKSFPFHSIYEKGGSIISISMSFNIEKDNAIDICNEIIDKYTIKFGTPTNVNSNKNQKKWTWVGKKNIFVIKYIADYYLPTLTIQLAEKEYYLR